MVYFVIINLVEIVREVDIVVVVLGKVEFVWGDWFKLGVVVIDVGINVVDVWILYWKIIIFLCLFIYFI